MARPVPILEFAPTSSPLDGAPVWVDISTRMRTGRTHRGRQHELGTFQAGTFDVVCDNRDGNLNPWNTSSPWYNSGNGLVPDKPIRLRAVHNAITYPVWRGFIDAFNPVWDSPVDSEMELRCSDGFKIFQRGGLTSSLYRDTVVADGATAYYRLGEVSGTSAIDEIAGRTATYRGVVTLSTAGALLTDVDTAVDLGSSTGSVRCPPGAAVTGSGAFSFEVWARIDTVGATNRLMEQWDTGGGDFIVLAVASDRTVSFGYFLAGVGPTSATSSALSNDGAFHHIVGTRNADGKTIKLYVDGVLADTQVAASATAPPAGGTAWLGNGFAGFSGAAGQIDAAVDEFAIYNGVELTATKVSTHYQYGRAGYAGQLSGARIGVVADIVGWPAADRNIDAGLSAIQAATSNQSSTAALAYMQTIELSEVGALFMSADGKLTFHQRDKVLKSPYTTSQLTLGPANEPYELEGTQPTGDDTEIYNEVVTQREGGVTHRVTDATSITAHGRVTLSETGLLNTTEGEVIDRGNYRLSQAKDFRARIERVHVRGQDDAAVLFPQVLTRDLRERITFIRTFMGQGATFTQQVLIEGIEHEITEDDWHTYYALTPADTLAYWILGTSTLGTDTRLAF